MHNRSPTLIGLIFLATICHVRTLAVWGQQAPEANSTATQNGSASLEGTVTDSTGAVLVGAQVSVRNAAGEVKLAVTDSAGRYRINGLAPGSYDVTVSAEAFSNFNSSGLIVRAGVASTMDAQLAAAGGATTVSVTTQKSTQIETENAEVSGTLNQKEIVSLGLNGRNFSSLISLAPGVSNQTGQDEAKVGVVGSAKFSVNGGRVEYNTFSVDGNDVLNADIAASHGHATLLVYPSVDAIQEMKVLTSNYGAQYGRSASGTVQVALKSGGSKFHGNVYEFLRNEVFNSRNYFDAPGKAPLYRRNDFGGTIGGPIYKDKTFFFFSEEFRKERSPFQFNQGVPSDAERGYNLVTQSYGSVGDFSDVCPGQGNVSFSTAKYPDCPGSGTSGQKVSYLYNQITLAEPALAILRAGLIPRANSTTGCNSSTGSCYVQTVSPPTDYREDLFRFDQSINDKTKFYVSGVHDHWQTVTAVPQWATNVNSFPTVLNSFVGPGASLIGHVTNVITSTLLSDFSVGVTAQRIKLYSLPGPGVILSRSALDGVPDPIGSLFNNGGGGKLPGIVIAGNNPAYGGNGFNSDTSFEPWFHTIANGTISENVSKYTGKHSFQFGVQFVEVKRHEYSSANGANTGNVQGVLTFRNTGSYLTTGNAFADFIFGGLTGQANPQSAGDVQSFQQDNTQITYHVAYFTTEPFFQDDWKVTPRLTVNLGLRVSMFYNWRPDGHEPLFNWLPDQYDGALPAAYGITVNSLHGYLQPVQGAADRTGAPLPLDIANLNPVMTNGLVECGYGGIPKSCQTSHVFNPAPRVGFAWDPTGLGKTSIRGGYGLFFEHGTGSEANAASLMANPPSVLSMQEDTTFYTAIGKFNGGNVQAAFPLNVVSIPTKTIWPYAQQWSFGIQHQIDNDTAATLSYVGSKGTHLSAAMQINQLPPVSSGNNPFSLHQPIVGAQYCQASTLDYTDPHNPTTSFTFPDGSQLSYKDNPSAVLALIAACDGTPGGPTSVDIDFPLNWLRPYKGIGSVEAIRDVAGSVYHSAQFTLRHNHGPLDVGVSYTFSHSIDSASDRFSSTFVDSFNLAANRASSDFDQRHLLNIDYIYQLPAITGWSRLRDAIGCTPRDVETGNASCPPTVSVPTFGDISARVRSFLSGWSLSGITLFQTGTPFSVVNGAGSSGIAALDNAGLALGNTADSYPDVSISKGNCNTSSEHTRTFGPLLGNPCHFVAPRGLTQGNAGRNSFNNPPRLNFDMALLKDFKVWGEHNLEFRSEAFNVFNVTQFRIYDPNKGNTGSNTVSCYGGPETGYSAGAPSCIASNAFLHPVDAHRPRTVQFGLKLEF
ncbi:MAG TPA: carboxypeptidase regulatory-like domain-containing protein [Acidisarcina sp.]